MMSWSAGYRAIASLTILAAVSLSVTTSRSLFAQQQAPAIGYMYPPGGQAGTVVDVVLGGYDWTPDIEVFTHEPTIRLEITAPPSSVIVPEPPYWFGKKARRGPFLLPREIPAKLTIPPGTPPGIYRWQAANANGATAAGRFIVSRQPEVREQADRSQAQRLDSLPVIVSGQVRKIEEVDDFRFVAPHDGPITLSLASADIGSPLTAAVEVRDADGRLIAEATDTQGSNLRLTLAGKAEQAYVASIYDVDFRGNRSFVYRLAVLPGPQVVAAMPAAGRRGETRDVEFVGYGVATGSAVLETITREVAFPDEPADSFVFNLKTPHGSATPVRLRLSDIPESVEPERRAAGACPLSVPSAVTGVITQRYGTDRYLLNGKKGDVWKIDLQAKAIGSKLDVALSLLDGQGKELKRADDLPGTTDAGLEFTVPADGSYELIVSDSSGSSGHRAATYRLAVREAEPGFSISGPEFVNVVLGGKTQLAIKATRTAGFKEPINLRIEGLPPGISVPEETVIAAGKKDAKIELTAAADAGTVAALLRVSAHARIGELDMTKRSLPTLLAITMKPPFSIDAEGKNDVTKWPRGTTFPAPVLIEREEGFVEDIVLEMAARQGRHRQGIRGPELTVAPDVKRISYPVFLPEWLETTRTSRMVVNGVAQIADPQGRVRYLSSKLKTRIGFLPTGALLKIDCDVPELEVTAGQPFEIPLTVNRANGLTEVATIELVPNPKNEAVLSADRLRVTEGQSRVMLSVTPTASERCVGERQVKVRATVLQKGHLPAVSETSVLVAFVRR